jgi:hypothetical protein
LLEDSSIAHHMKRSYEQSSAGESGKRQDAKRTIAAAG